MMNITKVTVVDTVKQNATYQPVNPNCILFKWSYSIENMSQHDSSQRRNKKLLDILHTLYLLQHIIQQRNHESINNLDCAQIITNILDWHNENKFENNFNGMLFDEFEVDSMFVIQNILSKIGGIPLFTAQKVYHKLKVIEIDNQWIDFPLPVLKLTTHGYWKIYPNNKALQQCTLQEITFLLRIVGFQTLIERGVKKGKKMFIESVDDW
eukprot:480719_1